MRNRDIVSIGCYIKIGTRKIDCNNNELIVLKIIY